MRRRALILGLVLLLIVSSGCTGEEEAPPTTAPETIPTTQPPTTPTPTVTSAPAEPTTPPPTTAAPTAQPPRVEFTMTSTGFDEGESIPVKYACDGEDLSPALSWTAPPEGTESLALIMDDPDAPVGVFTHWVIYNIPAAKNRLDEGVPKGKVLDDGSLQGVNDFGEVGYGGPCPPPGPAHTYRFHLYALDAELNLPSGATKEEVVSSMQGHILADMVLSGEYGR